MYILIYRQTDIHTDRHTDIQTDIQSDEEMDGGAKRQTDRHYSCMQMIQKIHIPWEILPCEKGRG